MIIGWLFGLLALIVMLIFKNKRDSALSDLEALSKTYKTLKAEYDLKYDGFKKTIDTTTNAYRKTIEDLKTLHKNELKDREQEYQRSISASKSANTKVSNLLKDTRKALQKQVDLCKNCSHKKEDGNAEVSSSINIADAVDVLSNGPK